jgi:hypothetical protein
MKVLEESLRVQADAVEIRLELQHRRAQLLDETCALKRVRLGT